MSTQNLLELPFDGITNPTVAIFGREWVHWVRVNIPGDNLPCDGKDGGEDLKAYVGSGPPKDTGLHRYVFLVFKQVWIFSI